jgi:thioredoxin reductase
MRNMPNMRSTWENTMHTTTTPEFDAIVIGGSYAGLSAATQLARARQRRNRFAHASHGFLTQDGTEAAVIAATARGQLLKYPNVRWIEGSAAQAQAQTQSNGFIVTLADGTACTGRRLVLATGVRDELPPIAGLQERWGRSVFHCPYCHGYELDAGAIGVLAVGPLSMHHALMLPDWGTVTFFLNGAFEPDAAQLAALDGRGVTLERTAIARIAGEADVALVDGRVLPMAGLFVGTQMHAASPIAAQLGCATEDGPMGAFVGTDAMQASSVPGVFCCGDMARGAGNVAFAVADGAMAGVAAHRSLMELHPA